MTITKYGHCCLLIETKGIRVLTDPGQFSDGFSQLEQLDVILITHEHADHVHAASLKALMERNETATVLCNARVGQILTDLQIAHTVVEDKAEITVGELKIKAYAGKHVEIIGDHGLVPNTGFCLGAGEFFYPGDAYTIPDEPVTLLALPVAGTWCKVSEAIAYALAIKPKHAIAVHDAVLSEAGKLVTYPHFERELSKEHILFTALIDGEPQLI